MGYMVTLEQCVAVYGLIHTVYIAYMKFYDV